MKWLGGPGTKVRKFLMFATPDFFVTALQKQLFSFCPSPVHLSVCPENLFYKKMQLSGINNIFKQRTIKY